MKLSPKLGVQLGFAASRETFGAWGEPSLCSGYEALGCIASREMMSFYVGQITRR